MMSKFSFDISVRLTSSKIMAFMILAIGAYLGANTFMFAVPFSSALVLGKQYYDSKVGLKNEPQN